jgi:hypothetical protein
MKEILFFLRNNRKQWYLTTVCCLMILSALLHVSCQDVYDKIKEFSPEEVIYPAHFDTIGGRIGYERIEIYLSKHGRISSSEMNLGKATKTIVQYGSETIVYDSVCSWIQIDSLTLPNLYRFKIYTANDVGDMSIPVEIALTPYTASDLAALSLSTPDLQSTTSALVEWKTRLSSSLYNVYAYSYEYVDRNRDTVRGGEEGDAVSFFVENVERNTPVPVDLTLKMLPLVANVPILDTLYKTFTTTVIVNGVQPVIILDKPELDYVFVKGFNSSAEAMTFSWRPVDEVSDYTLKISDSYNFPDDATRTFTVDAGNVDSYTLSGEEQFALYTLSNNSSIVRPILYWTVVPTNGDPNIITQTRMIAGRKVIKLSPTGGANHMVVTTDADGSIKFATSGADPYIHSTTIDKIIYPGASADPGKLTLTFQYKSDYSHAWTFFFCRPNASGDAAASIFLPSASEWKEAVFDIGLYMAQFNWGTAANHRFRIDPGDANASTGLPANRILYLANMQLNIY